MGTGLAGHAVYGRFQWLDSDGNAGSGAVRGYESLGHFGATVFCACADIEVQ